MGQATYSLTLWLENIVHVLWTLSIVSVWCGGVGVGWGLSSYWNHNNYRHWILYRLHQFSKRQEEGHTWLLWKVFPSISCSPSELCHGWLTGRRRQPEREAGQCRQEAAQSVALSLPLHHHLLPCHKPGLALWTRGHALNCILHADATVTHRMNKGILPYYKWPVCSRGHFSGRATSHKPADIFRLVELSKEIKHSFLMLMYPQSHSFQLPFALTV